MPMHAHGEAQLTFAASGMVQVHTGEGRWLVPPQLAVWVPAGVAHRVEALTDAELWMVHWQPSAVLTWAPSTLRERDAFALRITHGDSARGSCGRSIGSPEGNRLPVCLPNLVLQVRPRSRRPFCR